MKTVISFLFVCLIAISSNAQTEEVKTMHETAKNFMRTGDFDNAILVLTRALQQDKNSLELQKDLIMSYYLKRDYKKALEGVENLIDRDDADVVTFQIAGNVYKALEQVKDCEKIYKQGLKKFPRSGPLYSEYGNNGEFARTYLNAMSKQASLASKGITTETLTMIRTRFILDWYETNATKYPFRLFDYQQQLLQEGMFDAYNHWLFEPTENLAAYDNWTKTHAEEFNAFNTFQRSRVFKMPFGQYYQAR